MNTFCFVIWPVLDICIFPSVIRELLQSILTEGDQAHISMHFSWTNVYTLPLWKLPSITDTPTWTLNSQSDHTEIKRNKASQSLLRNNILTAVKRNENALCQCCFLIRSDLFFLALLWSLSCISARWTELAMVSAHTMANGINFLCASIFSFSSINYSLHTSLNSTLASLN